MFRWSLSANSNHLLVSWGPAFKAGTKRNEIYTVAIRTSFAKLLPLSPNCYEFVQARQKPQALPLMIAVCSSDIGAILSERRQALPRLPTS